MTPLAYAAVYSFLHSGTPSLVLLTQGGASKSAPSWLSSLAVKYKAGKKVAVACGHARLEEEPLIAPRLGVTTFPALFAVLPAADGAEAYTVALPKPVPASGAAAIKLVKEWMDGLLAGGAPPDARQPLPAFPAPDVPRKQAAAAYAPLTEDNLQSACYSAVGKPMCALALVSAPGGEFAEAAALQELARRYRNDPISFVWLDVASQPEFAAALGAPPPPALVVLKPSGKRPRLTAHEGPLSVEALARTLDKVLGGDAHFKVMKELPEMVSPEMRAALKAAEAEL